MTLCLDEAFDIWQHDNQLIFTQSHTFFVSQLLSKHLNFFQICFMSQSSSFISLILEWSQELKYIHHSSAVNVPVSGLLVTIAHSVGDYRTISVPLCSCPTSAVKCPDLLVTIAQVPRTGELVTLAVIHFRFHLARQNFPHLSIVLVVHSHIKNQWTQIDMILMIHHLNGLVVDLLALFFVCFPNPVPPARASVVFHVGLVPTQPQTTAVKPSSSVPAAIEDWQLRESWDEIG